MFSIILFYADYHPKKKNLIVYIEKKIVRNFTLETMMDNFIPWKIVIHNKFDVKYYFFGCFLYMFIVSFCMFISVYKNIIIYQILNRIMNYVYYINTAGYAFASNKLYKMRSYNWGLGFKLSGQVNAGNSIFGDWPFLRFHF